jgi:transposase
MMLTPSLAASPQGKGISIFPVRVLRNWSSSMKTLSKNEVFQVSGGEYQPPFNPEEVPYRAAWAAMGGYVNNYIFEYTGFSPTGDTIAGNGLIGLAAVSAPIGIIGSMLSLI